MKKHVITGVFALTMILMTACGDNSVSQVRYDSSDRQEITDEVQESRLDEVSESVEKLEVEEWSTGENISQYLGGAYSPENPFMFYQDGNRIITDKNGNVLLREKHRWADNVTDSVFPDDSHYVGSYWSTTLDIGEDSIRGILYKNGEIVYEHKKGYLETYEFDNGRIVFECTLPGQNWLIDENFKRIHPANTNLEEINGQYYKVYADDYHRIIYDYNDNVIYEAPSNHVEVGLTSWETAGDYYYWINDRTQGQSSNQGGDFKVFHLPDNKEVFSAKGVMDINEYGGGVVFALAENDYNNTTARIVSFYRGELKVDVTVPNGFYVSVYGKYFQNCVYIKYYNYGWNYVEYGLKSGNYVRQGTEDSYVGQIIEKAIDQRGDDWSVNMALAEKWGVDYDTYLHEPNYMDREYLNAKLFHYLERENGQRIFFDLDYDYVWTLYDDVKGETLLRGNEIYGMMPGNYRYIESIFAYATNGEGVGRLMNLATGKALNVTGEFVVSQKTYMVFKEDEKTYRVYNFDLDSFVVDVDGNVRKEATFEEMRKTEPAYGND